MAKKEPKRKADFRKAISMHSIIAFRLFVEKIVKNNQKFKDIHEELGELHPSSLERQLHTLNEKIHELCAFRLFNYNRATKKYSLTDAGEKFYLMTDVGYKSFGTFENFAISKSDVKNIRVAINAFSFYIFQSIEEKMRNKNAVLKFDRKIEYKGTDEIFSTVKNDPTIDVGIGESIVERNSTDAVDYLQISKKRIELVTNFELFSENQTQEVDLKTLQDIPLIIGHTETFWDYLILFSKAHGYDSEKDLLGLDNPEKYRMVSEVFDIRSVGNSINLMMDMLIYENHQFGILVTPEVKKYLFAYSDSLKETNDPSTIGKMNDVGKNSKTIKSYFLEDNEIRIRKYVCRKKYDNYDSNSEITNLFWDAAECLYINKN